MNLTPYVKSLRQDLTTTAEAGGADARALAERLAGPLESATRLALLDALSAAADEITRDLAPGSVEVRLRGREPCFVVTPPPTDEATAVEAEISPTSDPATAPSAQEGGTSRINFRLPDRLKRRIEEAAGREGLSVNAWLVRTTSAAVHSPDGVPPAGRRAGRTPRRYTGWVR